MVSSNSPRLLGVLGAAAAGLLLGGLGWLLLPAVMASGLKTVASVGAAPTVAPPANAAPQAVALQGQMVDVVRSVTRSVVQVQTSSGLGSGVIFDSKGDVITNAHVASGSTSFEVTLANGKRYVASLVGIFRPDDLAVLRIQGSGFQSATFADSSALQVGDIVLAIGNPLGLTSSVTDGIVSAVNRTVSEGGGITLPGVIQTSAPINPGNSGGALVDLEGQVVGIPTLAAIDPQLGSQANGIGFAISSNMAKDIATQLVRYGHVINSHRAYLGVSLFSTSGAGGALVASVEPVGPAAGAGILPGDLITTVDGHSTPSDSALSEVLANLMPGQKVPVRIIQSSGAGKTVTVTLGQYPGSLG